MNLSHFTKLKIPISFKSSAYSKLVMLAIAVTTTAGCSSEFAFQEIDRSCEPPKSSARYGKNQGPVITFPGERQPFNTSMTVSGTCADGFPITLNGRGVDGEYSPVCANGSFSAVVNFKTGDGVRELDVSQETIVGQNITDRRCFTQDSVPPKVAIAGTSGAQAINTSTAHLEGTCESGLEVIIEGPQLVSPVTTECVRGHFTATVEFTGVDGLKDVEARQVDLAGNSGADDKQYLTDRTPPTVTITSPNPMTLTQGNIIVSGTCESGPRVVLQGGLLSGVHTADCLSGVFSAAISLSAGDGVKAIEATQTDVAGNTGSANRNFVKDATPPNVRFTTPLANSISTGSITVTGTCETGLNVQLSGAGLASSVNTACNSSAFTRVINLVSPDGAKEIIATQTDPAGNIGTDTRSFVRDGTAPIVTITSPAVNSVWATSLTLQGACETGLPVVISGAGLASHSSTACKNSTYSTLVELSSGDGVKNIIATQTDIAGNSGSVNRNFIRDTSSPMIAITQPVNNSYVGNSAIISGTCETGLDVLLNGSGVQSNATTSCVAGAFSTSITFTSAQGNKEVRATQTDLAANTAFDLKTYIKDTVNPNVTITQPAANSIWASELTLQGACETGLSVNISGPGALTSVHTACAAGTYSVLVPLSAGDGDKNILASQTDLAGNIGSANRTFIRDSSAPTLAITGPAANTSAKAGLTLVGTCETGLTVQLSGAGLSSPASTACTANAFSVAITFSTGDGSKNIIASQTDLVGNTGTSSRTFIRDSVAPAVAITSPAANSYVAASGTISGTCETGLNVVITGTGTTANVNTSCSAGNFSASVSFTTGDGPKQVVATQTDLAGNSSSDTRSFIRDSSGPAIAITAPANNTVAQNGVTLSGTCETGLTVQLSGAGLSSPATTACTASAFSVAITFSSGDGAKNIIASQTDLAGNSSSDTRTFQRDNTAPIITITSPAANTAAQTGVTLAGACESGLTVHLTGSGLSSPASTTCSANAYSVAITFTAGDGNKNIIVSQTDAIGNSASANRTFIRDNTSPVVTITAPAENSTVGASAIISGTCETGLTVTINGAGVTGSINTACSTGAFSANVNFTAGDGAKQVVATQTDTALNSGTSTRSFIRDSTAPSITITAPAPNSVHSTTLTLTGTCESGLTVSISGTGVASNSSTSCTAGTFSAAITLSNGDGAKNVSVSQTDALLNTGTDTRTFIRDGTAPVITISSPAANTAAQTGVTLSGACETGLTVLLSGTGLSSPATTTCTASAYSVAITFTAGDGVKNIIARQTDLAGNTGSANRNFTRDNTPPTVAITSPAAGTITSGNITISGTCENGLIVSISGNVNAPSTTTCSLGMFSTDITFSAPLGAKNITASQTDLAGNTGSDSRSFQKQNNATSEVFTSKGPGGKVDILFVDDNSASMEAEQAALGTKFSSFTSALSGLDWQAGIVTTDCTSGSTHNFCGQLFDLTGRPAGEYILTSATPSFATVFSNTIQRPETIDCLLSGTCPSGREEGMKSTIQAMNLRDTTNAGFFRNDSDLAVVYLTDEDESSNGPSTATQPNAVVSAFQAIWGNTKKFSSYGIIVKPGDTACYDYQRTQFGSNANYANLINQLTSLTGGMSVSICEPDYSVTLTQIGNDVTRLSKSFDLANTPLSGTVSVGFSPAFTTTFTVIGKRVTLDTIPPMGTQITISYQY